MVNRSSVEPPWEQVAQIIRDRIADGTYPPGDRIPSARSLAQEFGLNMKTVSKALAALKDEGLLDSRTGWGYFVTR